MQALELKVPPVAFALLCAALMWAISTLCSAAAFPVAGNPVIAGAFAFIGGGIAVAGVFAFRRHDTTVNPTRPGSADSVVSDGIYRLTRNPMYLGLALILAGWAMYLENAAALLLLPVFVVYINYFQIKPEERSLLAKFGPSYAEYLSTVRRWV